MTLQLLHSEFPYVWGKFDFIYNQCTEQLKKTCFTLFAKAISYRIQTYNKKILENHVFRCCRLLMKTKYVPAKQREEQNERKGGSHYGSVSSKGWGGGGLNWVTFHFSQPIKSTLENYNSNHELQRDSVCSLGCCLAASTGIVSSNEYI